MAAKAATKSATKTTTTTASKPTATKAKTTLTPDPVPTPVAAPTTAKTVPYPQSPVLSMNQAIIVGVVNFFFPGLGTIVAGVMGNKPMIGRGIAQFLLVIAAGAGWIWALITSIQCLTNANSAKTTAA